MRNKIIFFIGLLFIAVTIFWLKIKTCTTDIAHTVILCTNYGDIVFATYDDDAPKAVDNFITLAEQDFYDGLSFHRVINDFMIQGGDPFCTNGQGVCGTGGPGFSFADELNPNTVSAKEGYVRGVVAMANSGPNTNGSQFFIVEQDTFLPHNYTIFGKVISGEKVVEKIASVKVDSDDRPLRPVVIRDVGFKR